MTQVKIPAVFMRGGTSKAIMFHRRDLPEDAAEWDAIFMSVMGTPDPNGRQLDGMGGGISSLSKVCIIAPPSRPDADVDYTFAQVGVDQAVVDYSGNCGNMSSAVGPFALDEGLVRPPSGAEAVVRIHNTNTGKIIVSRFRSDEGRAAVAGDEVLDGVSGSGSPVRLEFTDPGGSKTGRLLPSGNAFNQLNVPDLGLIEASLIDAANPCVFVRAEALGCSGTERPMELEQSLELMQRLEAIRRAASVAMDIAPSLEAAGAVGALPKVAMVCGPAAATTLSGRALDRREMDVCVRMISVGRPHRAVPLTGALCLAVAAKVPGSLVNAISRGVSGDVIRIAHPSGVTVVEAKLSGPSEISRIRCEYAAVYRTARRLFEGNVCCTPRE